MPIKVRQGGAWVDVAGDKGLKGQKGDKGEKGQKGDKGLKGDVLAKGIKGEPSDEKGEKGDKGDKGAPAPGGIAGVTKVAQLWDEKTSGTDGGTFNSGSWIDRTLNQENDPNGIVVLNSGNVYWELEAGTYRITWSAPANNVHLHKTRLVYADNSGFGSPTYIKGSSGFDSANMDPNSQTRSFGDTQLTITAKRYFKIQHRCTISQTAYGLGGATGLDAEVYTQVFIEDLSSSVLKGNKGDKGDKGQKGEDGQSIGNVKGNKGDKGDKGLKGELVEIPDTKGEKGEKGEKGLKGDVLAKGTKGEPSDEKGDKGEKGDVFAKGAKGEPSDEKGDKGEKGDVFAKGIKGEPSDVKGDKGEPGDVLAKGIKGDKGVKGDKGQFKGEKGKEGDKGDPGDVLAKGVKGDEGDSIKGQKGEQGSAANIVEFPIGGIMLCITSRIPGASNGLDSSKWTVCNGSNASPNLTNKFVMGAGGTQYAPNSGGNKGPDSTGGYADGFVWGHFHLGEAHGEGNHGHKVRYSTDTGNIGNFDSYGGFVLDEGPISDQNGHAAAPASTRGQQVGLPSGGNGGVNSTDANGNHKHTINTWGVVYDNSKWPQYVEMTVPDGNKTTDGLSWGRNLPPYYKLYYVMRYA